VNQKINIYLNSGGLGDRIAAMPAIIYCLKNFQNMSCDIITPDYFVPLARHFLRGYEERAAVLPMSTMAVTLDQTIPSVVMHNNYVTSLRRHLVDLAFDIINDTCDVPVIHKNYPKVRLDDIDTVKLFPFTRKYVVLTPGYTAPVRALPAKTWNRIAKWIQKRGILPVWIGAKASTVSGGPLDPPSQFVDGIDYNLGIDLRDKTTLLEAAKLMALSEVVVGVDNGLIHLAACSDVKIIAGYTSVDPKTRLPYRKNQMGTDCYVIEPPDFIECKFRQSRSHFDYDTDYRTCPCGGADCVESLTAEKFIKELEKII
jgi:ADP-heptose:LPS heptosyltransferase